MKQATCKGCGKKIEWIEIIEPMADGTSKIKRIPLDPRPPTYAFDGELLKWKRSNAYVSHFATCPNANDFSKKEETKNSNTDESKGEPWWKNY